MRHQQAPSSYICQLRGLSRCSSDFAACWCRLTRADAYLAGVQPGIKVKNDTREVPLAGNPSRICPEVVSWAEPIQSQHYKARSSLASMGSSMVTLWSFMSCTRACSDRNAARPTCPAAAAMSPGARGGCASVPCDSGAACAPRTSRSTMLASQA